MARLRTRDEIRAMCSRLHCHPYHMNYRQLPSQLFYRLHLFDRIEEPARASSLFLTRHGQSLRRSRRCPEYYATFNHSRSVQSQPFRSVPSSSPPYPSRNPTHYPSPRSATIRPASQESYTTRFVDRQPSVMLGPQPARPDMFRRHSAHPYDSSSSQSQYASASTDDFGGTSRAPISRTTKACNACRSRKVRCDAGGLPNGEPADCSRCREAGAECIYSGPQKKRGPCPG